MASLELISKQRYKRLSWKNGLGFTDEIAIFPEGSELKRGDFLWRLSSARIEQSSPFSVFPNHDRVLIVLKGKGVRIIHTFEEGAEEEVMDLPPLQAYDFPGDISSRCELISGPITDLSVFVKKAEVEPLVELVELEEDEKYSWVPLGRWNFVFSAEGHFEVSSSFLPPRDQGTQILEEGDALSAELDEPFPHDETVEIRSLQRSGKLVVLSLQ